MSECAAALAEDSARTPAGRPWPVGADLLVNCTSVGLGLERSSAEGSDLNQLCLGGDQYRRVLICRRSRLSLRVHPVLAAAAARGAHTIDGLEILVAQGALSLRLWTGHEPPLEIMRAAARAG